LEKWSDVLRAGGGLFACPLAAAIRIEIHETGIVIITTT
jgi:hypothetical protein